MTFTKQFLLRILSAFIGLVTGAIVYTVAAIIWGSYNGFGAFIFQPILAFIISGVFVAVSFVGGLIISWILKYFKIYWRPTYIHAATLAIMSLLLLIFGSTIGITATYINPDTNETFKGIHPIAGIGAYFVLLFVIVNWPIKTSKKVT